MVLEFEIIWEGKKEYNSFIAVLQDMPGWLRMGRWLFGRTVALLSRFTGSSAITEVLETDFLKDIILTNLISFIFHEK